MKTGKYMKKSPVKGIALALVLVLLLGCGIGGTIAWLLDTTDPVVNTFTVGKVELTLTESPLNADGTYGAPAEGTQNAYQLIPGKSYTKDPKVTVTENSEDCWLFVMFEEDVNAATYINYTSTLTTANQWNQGDGTSIPANVWYREVKKTDTTRSWNLLENDTITINGNTVTNENMTNAASVALKYTAYAVQMANRTVEQAWALVDPT